MAGLQSSSGAAAYANLQQNKNRRKARRQGQAGLGLDTATPFAADAAAATSLMKFKGMIGREAEMQQVGAMYTCAVLPDIVPLTRA